MLTVIKKAFIASIFCSLILIGTASSFKASAGSDTKEPVLSEDVSKNDEFDSVFANLYELDEVVGEYELIISGSGAMRDYTYPNFPLWFDEYSDKIVRVTIKKDVTNIGKNAFSFLEELCEIYIENPEILLPATASLIPENAKIFSHKISNSEKYSKAYGREFFSICSFNLGKCTVCNYECASHIGGEPTCITQGVCKLCGLAYGDMLSHNLSEWNEAVDASCTSDGAVGHYTCSSCNRYFDKNKSVIESVIIKSNGHAYGVWQEEIPPGCESKGQRGHYHCALCEGYFDINKSEIFILDIKEIGHKGGFATCSELAICELCQKPYGSLNPEEHHFSSELIFNEENHFHACSCGAVSDTKAHTYIKHTVRAATAELEGILEYICDCGYSYTEIIPKLPLEEDEPPQNDNGAEDDDDYEDDNSNEDDNKIGTASIIMISLTSLSALAAIAVLVLNFIKSKRKQ